MRKDLLLEVTGLQKYFPIKKGFLKKIVGYVKAVDNINFHIKKGRIFGLVGESGSGKSTVARTILKAYDQTAGKILFNSTTDGEVELSALTDKEMRKYRKEMQMVFQDPFSSLNPRMTVKDILAEPLIVNDTLNGGKVEDRVGEVLEIVGLQANYMRRYPHAFSGGQRQRIAIARAIILKPEFIVCDESVSALDVSVQAQILNLLKDLQKEFNLTYLFIAHDLSVIKHICDEVAVMYVGKIIETASAEELFAKPKHPYTEALLSAVPKTDPKIKSNRILLKGEIPDPSNPPSGCHFHTRCQYSKDICRNRQPELINIYGSEKRERFTACHLFDDLNLTGIQTMVSR